MLFILLVMGYVIKNGLDVFGLGWSYYLDRDFQVEVQIMMDFGKSFSIFLCEKKYINVVKLWV